MSETMAQSGGTSAGEESGQAASETDLDIAIIGAGPAGLYTAWRLLQHPAYASKRICLFDAADRVGGRVLSVTLPEVPYVLELGAMRYIPDQILIRSLVEKLQLETAEFSFETVGYRLRSRFITDSDLKRRKASAARKRPAGKKVIPYIRRSQAESDKNPVELIVHAIIKSVRKLTLPNVEDKPEAQGIDVENLRTKLKSFGKTSDENLVLHFAEKEWQLIKRYSFVGDRELYRV